MVGHFVGQTDEPLLSDFFTSNAHIPPCTASNRTGFKSPYSPEATSMTEKVSEIFNVILDLHWVVAIKHEKLCKYEQLLSGHTEVCRVVVGRTVKAQSLQIGDEVWHCAFVDTLTLTQNVKLWKDKTI